MKRLKEKGLEGAPGSNPGDFIPNVFISGLGMDSLHLHERLGKSKISAPRGSLSLQNLDVKPFSVEPEEPFSVAFKFCWAH